MPFYYYFLFIALPVSVLLIRSFMLRKKNLSIELFIEGLKNENNGHFEEALIGYMNALGELNKTGANSRLKDKIIEKIKVLHTMIDYKNNFRLISRSYK